MPGGLCNFHQEMYVHLIDWVRKHLTIEPGCYRDNLYDALLPDNMREMLLPIYPASREDFNPHQAKHKVKKHKFINHFASSQAACANLFLPMLKYSREAALVLRDEKTRLG